MSHQNEFDYDVFISYSSLDANWVRKDLLTQIEKAGLRAFIDFRDFKRGAASIKEMERGVLRSRKTLLILTPNYIESDWCEIENIMLQTLSPGNNDLRLIPLLKKACEKPLRIAPFTHIDFTDDADLDLAWDQLLSALEAHPAPGDRRVLPANIQDKLDKAKKWTAIDKDSKAIPILEKALVLADKSTHVLARVKVRINLAGSLYRAREDYKGAEKHYRDALSLIPDGNRDLQHEALHGLGSMLTGSGRLEEAKAVIDKSLGIAKLSGKEDYLINSLMTQSLLEAELGYQKSALAKMDEAIQLLLQQALFTSDEVEKHNAGTLAVCYLNKASMFKGLGELDEALSLIKKAEEKHKVSKDKLDAGKALIILGEIYCEKAEWGQGFDCFKRALKLFKKSNNVLWEARGLSSLSKIYATHKEWGSALSLMMGAVKSVEESGHVGEQVHYLCQASELLRQWKTALGKEYIERIIHDIRKEASESEFIEISSALTAKRDELNKDLEQSICEDTEIFDLFAQAREIARNEHLNLHLSECLLDEAYYFTGRMILNLVVI